VLSIKSELSEGEEKRKEEGGPTYGDGLYFDFPSAHCLVRCVGEEREQASRAKLHEGVLCSMQPTRDLAIPFFIISFAYFTASDTTLIPDLRSSVQSIPHVPLFFLTQ
jgi:hypothetical protein